jgi:riboflavin synthase
MFTGLVEDTGTVVAVAPRGAGKSLAIRTRIPLDEVRIGDSIAVNGACLTAEHCEGDVFTALAGRETVSRTTLGGLRAGETVHLERALKLGDRLGGHLVQGHVDGVGAVRRSVDAGESWILWVSLPDALSRYVAEKGSLCVDGVSLTVNELAEGAVRLNLVPHTAAATRLVGLKAGALVNLEVDIVAKYVERLLGGDRRALDVDTLRKWGYPV